MTTRQAHDTNYYSDYTSTYAELYDLEIPLDDAEDESSDDSELPPPPTPESDQTDEEDGLEFPGIEEAEC